MRSVHAWAAIFREAPIGVLVLGLLLLLIGAGMLVGGVVFVASGSAGEWPVWVALFGLGPLAIYVALEFVSGRRWAWIAVVAALALFGVSGVLRALLVTGLPIAPLAEIAASAGSIAYLLRPRVRRAFDR